MDLFKKKMYYGQRLSKKENSVQGTSLTKLRRKQETLPGHVNMSST